MSRPEVDDEDAQGALCYGSKCRKVPTHSAMRDAEVDELDEEDLDEEDKEN